MGGPLKLCQPPAQLGWTPARRLMPQGRAASHRIRRVRMRWHPTFQRARVEMKPASNPNPGPIRSIEPPDCSESEAPPKASAARPGCFLGHHFDLSAGWAKVPFISSLHFLFDGRPRRGIESQQRTTSTLARNSKGRGLPALPALCVMRPWLTTMAGCDWLIDSLGRMCS